MSKEAPSAFLQSVDPLLLQPQYPIFARGLSIGRDADLCEIVLARETVSRRHCAVQRSGDTCVLADLGTTNGTYVNGERISRHALLEGDRIGLGMPAPHQFVFSRRAAPNVRRHMLGRKSQYRIGRSLECDLPIPQDPTVSSYHARLWVQQNALYIEDRRSFNGTFVGGKPVKHARLLPQDEVLIGANTFSFEITAEGVLATMRDQRNQVRLETRKLGLQIPQKRLLHDISLVINPGEYVGVLGPSGAGKSTLLNALNGFQPANQGQVLLNEASLYSCYDAFRTVIGYVPQDDIIYPELTVEQSLNYTARMRLPRDTTRAQIEEHVTSVIDTLGLSHVRRTPVARLSGGQRKRVSIGCELLTKPSLLFLDEPTSGLDPSTEEKLMKHFRGMSEQGQTLIITTHILYSLDLVDLVVLLARGQLVYFGPVNELCPYFSSPQKSIGRPIEVFDLLEPERSTPEDRERIAEAYARKYQQSAICDQYVRRRSTAASTSGGTTPIITSQQRPPSTRPQPIEAARQLGILSQRVLNLKVSFPKRLLVPLMTPVVLALLTSTMSVGDQEKTEADRIEFKNNTTAMQVLDQTQIITGEELAKMRYEGFANLAIPLNLPLMIIMTAVFLGTLSACLEISAERPIYLRERAVNLRIPMYVASKLPALAALGAIQCGIYLAVMAGLLELNNTNLALLFGIMLLVTVVSSTIGLFISSMDPSPGHNSVTLAVVAVLPQIIFSGALGPDFYGGMSRWTQILAGVFPARWGFEMMLTAMYDQPEWARHLIQDAPAEGMGFQFGYSVYSTNSLMLVLLGLCYFTAACTSLKRFDKL